MAEERLQEAQMIKKAWFNCIEIQIFYSKKAIIDEVKYTDYRLGEIFAISITDSGLIADTYQELLKNK